MKPEKKTKDVKVQKKNTTLIAGIVAVILLAGVAYAVLSDNQGAKKTQDSEVKLPSYAYTNPVVLKAYKYATEHPEILEQIPCYCGCGGHSGHRFLRDCYIHDDWTYDEHASFCDVCVGEAIKVQEYLASGRTLKEARALIDEEYSKKGGEGTNTPQVSDNYIPVLSPKFAVATSPKPAPVAQIDLTGLSLPDNFKSLSDGLKLIPSGIKWAYFANLMQGTGKEQTYIQNPDFYGTPVIGMLNSEYSETSWIELHDVGKNAKVQANNQPNVDNLVHTRPFIFGTKDLTNSVLALFENPATNASAYSSFRSILDKVDDEDAGFAKINTKAPAFASVSYFGLIKSGSDTKGEIAFLIKDNGTVPLSKYNDLKNSSINRGFKSYELLRDNNILIIKMISNVDNVISEATQYYEIEI